MSYLDHRRQHILNDRPLPEKKKYKIPVVSKKRQAKLDAQKNERGDQPTQKQKWFDDRHKEMVGTCQCGCGNPSSKHDEHFRSSAAHIFPQRLFKSIQFHPLNWVERSYWNGCHNRMDNKSMMLWPNFADWDDIKEKFFILEGELTAEEKKKKFYLMLSELIRK